MLVKGGHLRGSREAADIFFDGREELLLTAPFIRGVSTHGTGCAYSAAVTAFLCAQAAGQAPWLSAKDYITGAIARSQTAGSHWHLNHFPGAKGEHNLVAVRIIPRALVIVNVSAD